MMTATAYAGPAIRPRTKKASLRRLTVIELRKMADTRAGVALLGITALIAIVMMFVLAFATKSNDGGLSDFFRNTLGLVGALLPVLGILAATSEWSQRTALSTFTLVPHRERIAAAKLGAVVLLAAVTTVVSLGTSAIGNGIFNATGGNGSWHLPLAVLANGLVGQVLAMVIGLAFGLLLMNSPLAIVAYFLVPTVIQVLTGVVHALEKPFRWIDLSGNLNKLTDAHVSSTTWAHVAVTAAVWLVLPLVVGMVRLSRREVK